jgi:choline-sulfatase
MTEQGNDVSRRGFIQRAGVAAAAAGVAGLGPAAAAQAAQAGREAPSGPPFRPRGPLRQRPNILLILADEYRYPVAYESAELQDFRSRYLTAEESLREDGLEFANHYVMSAACVPSRSSIFTGQYPSLHGVSQTTGAAKSSFELDMYWLDPDTVPTMGDYFEAGGYDTYYKGKWHVSEADIPIPGTHNALLTFDDKGLPDPETEAVYLAADRLADFGFHGWIGPEPHGSTPLNSGSSAAGAIGRDEKFATQAADLLHELAARGRDGRPWLMVNSYVNPHDITTWGALTLQSPNWNLRGQLEGSAVPDRLFDPARYAATSHEDLSGKPRCQPSYIETYPQMLQPTFNTLDYRRFYYQLQQNVNQQIQRVLDALRAHPAMAANTIVIFTSDHGDMLGAHGGMFQKWHQAYEESSHVPFIVHNPVLFSGRQQLDALTSHADLLPTLLGLAGLDPATLQRELSASHTEVHPLVGRDLSGVILGEEPPGQVSGPVYFMTDDEVSRGYDQVTTAGYMFRSVVQPNHVETVVAYLPTGRHGAREKWKYSRYSDNPQFWSDPQGLSLTDSHQPPPEEDLGSQRDVVTLVHGNVNRGGPKRATTTVKTDPVPDQAEAYNLARDPLELDNLAHSREPGIQATVRHLEALLHEQCQAKRLKPSSGTVPSQPGC